MISTSDLSLDDEAALYRDSFFHASEEEAPRKIVRKSVFSHPSQAFASRIVCYRCGQVGHMSSSCRGELPPLERLEASLERDIQAVIGAHRRQPHMKEDEFGLYSTEMSSPVSTKLNWKSSQFCCNCGKPGHRSHKCPRISFMEISSQMKEALHPHTRVPVKEVEEYFYDLWEE